MISFPAFLGIRSLLGALLVQVLPVIVNTNEGERLEGNLLGIQNSAVQIELCLLYTSPSPRDMRRSRMPSSA